jgi:hypothetical protein
VTDRAIDVEKCLAQNLDEMGGSQNNCLEHSLGNSQSNNLNNNPDTNVENNIEADLEEDDFGDNLGDNLKDSADHDLDNSLDNSIGNSVVSDEEAITEGQYLDHAPTSAYNEDWMSSRLRRTLFHIRLGDAWDNIVTIELGPSRQVDNFLHAVSQCFQVEGIGRLSILVPGNIVKLEKYVIHIEPSRQESFEEFLKVLETGITRLGVTRPLRYVLTATAIRQEVID